MDIRRLFLTVGLAIVSVMLWSQWQHYNATVISKPTATQKSRSNGAFVPPPAQAVSRSASIPSTQPATASSQRSITIATDVLNVRVNLVGGNIDQASLPQYPVSLQDKDKPMTILSPTPGKYYVLSSGWTDSLQTKPLLYQAQSSHYRLKSGEKELVVVLVAKKAGMQITKTLHFYRGQSHVRQDIAVINTSKSSISGSFYHQISRQEPDRHFASMAYNGGAVSTTSVPYQKVKYKDMQKANLQLTSRGGWVAMQQHYFLSAWLPNQHKTHYFYSGVNNHSDVNTTVYNLGFTSALIHIKPGQSESNMTVFYVGPEKMKALAALAPALDLTVDYGILSPISMAIFWCMKEIHHFVGNWGWSIILVTLLIKLLLYWPSAMSYRSMARMKNMAPRVKSLQERFKDDKQALSKATMELYRNEKVNPMGGCLPMLVQIPIFIALYWVLIESVELRQSPFIFWIHDLSVKDPFYILPILMGGSMFLQQKLSPAPADPAMAKTQLIMPIVFTVFFMHFPAGLVLYWLTNNLVSVAQQAYILKTYDSKADDIKRRKKKQR